jgi:hypothetical protein
MIFETMAKKGKEISQQLSHGQLIALEISQACVLYCLEIMQLGANIHDGRWNGSASMTRLCDKTKNCRANSLRSARARSYSYSYLGSGPFHVT